jgi:pyruvate,water dikinase
LKQSLRNLSGDEVFDFILKDKAELLAKLFGATAFGAVFSCQYVSGWINKNTEKNGWEEEYYKLAVQIGGAQRHLRDGAALCGVADIVRKYPMSANILSMRMTKAFSMVLRSFKAVRKTEAAMKEFLRKYGMRCPRKSISPNRALTKSRCSSSLSSSRRKAFKTREHIAKFEQETRSREKKKMKSSAAS